MASRFDHHHPDYDDNQPDWILIDDAWQGENRVKRKGSTYLPVTSGMTALGIGKDANSVNKPGQLIYDAYKLRAKFPEFTRATAEALVGIMVRESWDIDAPDGLKDHFGSITNRGESIDDLIDRLLEINLLYGRLGLLGEVGPGGEPRIVDYPALKVINWDDTPEGPGTDRRLKFVILDETDSSPNGEGDGRFQWRELKKFRALQLDASGYFAEVEIGDQGANERVDPAFQGRRFDRIPFVFVNAQGMTPEIGDKPLLGLARDSFTIYRGEADYRWSLFMQSQDTLVIRGLSKPRAKGVTEQQAMNDGTVNQEGAEVIMGTGAVLYLPHAEMDAKFIGVDSKGLEEQRAALENDYRRAEQFGVALLTSSNDAEAAETVMTRVRARTASLANVVTHTASGLEKVLRYLAEWQGLSGEVKVTPNLDFIENPATPAELAALIASKMAGAPISIRSIHDWMRRRDFTEMSFEEEMEAIAEDPDLIPTQEAGEPDEGDDEGGDNGRPSPQE